MKIISEIALYNAVIFWFYYLKQNFDFIGKEIIKENKLWSL